MTAQRVATVCADDFGLTARISRGIAELAGAGRITAVSCLVTGEGWATAAPVLASMPRTVQRGLHFNLSEGRPASAILRRRWPQLPTLPRLIVAAHAGRLPLTALAAEWQAQWQRFVDATGAPPAYIDGHQHVHQLPGVREIVVGAAAAAGVAVRNTGHVLGPGYALKRRLIECTGGRALARLLRAHGVAHNAALVGVYDFRATDYRGLMQGWLAALPAAGGLLLCHPAAGSDGAAGAAVDPIATARRREASYLGSAAFGDDLAAAGVSPGPVWSRKSSAG